MHGGVSRVRSACSMSRAARSGRPPHADPPGTHADSAGSEASWIPPLCFAMDLSRGLESTMASAIRRYRRAPAPEARQTTYEVHGSDVDRALWPTRSRFDVTRSRAVHRRPLSPRIRRRPPCPILRRRQPPRALPPRALCSRHPCLQPRGDGLWDRRAHVSAAGCPNSHGGRPTRKSSGSPGDEPECVLGR